MVRGQQPRKPPRKPASIQAFEDGTDNPLILPAQDAGHPDAGRRRICVLSSTGLGAR